MGKRLTFFDCQPLSKKLLYFFFLRFFEFSLLRKDIKITSLYYNNDPMCLFIMNDEDFFYFSFGASYWDRL